MTSYRTNQGTRYLIRKDYHQLVERMTRKEKREHVRQSQQSTPKSPFVEYLEQQDEHNNSDSSSDDDIPEQTPPTTIVNKTPTSSDKSAIHDDEISKTADDDDSTINTQLIKLANEVETEMDKAITDMTSERQNDLIPDEDKITTIIQSIFKTEFSDIMAKLERKEQVLDKQIQKNKTLNQTL